MDGTNSVKSLLSMIPAHVQLLNWSLSLIDDQRTCAIAQLESMSLVSQAAAPRQSVQTRP